MTTTGQQSQTVPGSPPRGGIGFAVGAALERIASALPGLLLVTARDPGMGTAFADAFPTRCLSAPGTRSRLAVAAGAALTGRPVVVFCEDPADAASGPWPVHPPLVAITSSLDVATTAWGGGVAVVMPTWPADVEPLLWAALEGGPACVHLHDQPVAEASPLALTLPRLDEMRVLTEGPHARVAAAGSLVAPLLDAAWRLAREGIHVTTLQFPALPGEGLGPRQATGHVLLQRDAASAMEWVPAPTHEAGEVAETLAARIRP